MSNSAPPRQRRLFKQKQQKPDYQVQIRPDGSRDVELPLMEHLREFRDRLVKSALAVLLTTVISLLFAQGEFDLLVKLAGPGHVLIALKPTETFVSYVKIAFYTGIAMAMPILVYQLFSFLAPGLTRTERRWITLSLPGITLFFVLGVLFCYFIVLPSALAFLLNFGGGTVRNDPQVSEFLSFVTHFLLAVGLAFETPIIVFILAKLGIATPQRLRKFRRWSIVLAFVIAAIITPTPDPVNQIIVAVPIILLYELGVLFARIGAKQPKKTG
ncbi:MAG: twin-arginine translocase subunit TatC [Chloroflexota bacterium]|nr:twin-arginine translocase subunit TatC [Chloroflexota bacterium]